MDWVGMSFSFVGTYYLPTKFKLGMMLFIIGNVLWLIYALPNEAWSVAVLNLIFLALNLRAWWKGSENVL